MGSMLPYIAYMDPMGNVSYQLSSKSVTLGMKKKPLLSGMFSQFAKWKQWLVR